VDLIVANDISKPGSGFDSDKNAATLISADGDESVPLGSKAELASHILDRAVRLLERADNVSRPRESSEP
jgi:phosphopantothenoylcysteine decarboxylase / phosphopantothenate---cysteine ligase